MANRLLQFWKKKSHFNSNFVNLKNLEFKKPSDIIGLQSVGLFEKTVKSLNVTFWR